MSDLEIGRIRDLLAELIGEVEDIAVEVQTGCRGGLIGTSKRLESLRERVSDPLLRDEPNSMDPAGVTSQPMDGRCEP